VFWRLRGNPCVRAIKIGLGFGQLMRWMRESSRKSADAGGRQGRCRPSRELFCWPIDTLKLTDRTPDCVRGDGADALVLLDRGTDAVAS